MSQPVGVKPATRRASRVPSTRVGDENTVAAGPRLVSKVSTGALGLGAVRGLGIGKGVTSVGVAAAGGKVFASSAAVGGPRRAMQDVSNATRAPAAGINKDPVKPISTRTRTQSSSSTSSQQAQQPPSSTGTGLSRLKITSVSAAAAEVKPRITVTRVGVKSSSTNLRADAPALPRDAHSGPGLGLGIQDAQGSDWVGAQMYGPEPTKADAVMVDSNAEIKADFGSLKRAHGDKYDEEDADSDDGVGSKVRIITGELDDEDDWMAEARENGDEEESERVLQEVREAFSEELDFWDTTMVAEYSEEIFEYMAELEDKAMPNPRYMDHQTEIEWEMRTTLIDWLLQVHMRYHMLPETLWIAINIVDRFLSNRVVSLIKFQLVGVTAMFVAAKYEEIMAPSVEEFVYMTEGGYTRDEILKGERIILQSLEFNISPYCSPYSWVRRISKADDYDIQTRTLSKFLMEVTLLDHRFLRAKPSMIAAIGMFLARKMLGGEWNESFVYYSNYTEAQLTVPTGFLLESIGAPEFDQKFVYKKYAHKKFLKASIFARNWTKTNSLSSPGELKADV